MANSVDPDETPRSAASDLGLHCLLRPVRSNRVNMSSFFCFVFFAGRSCTTATDCGRLEVTGPGGVITYGCPGNGEWGCHHTTSYSHGNCGCLHRETK